jgi:tryptophan 2,3-dioxygenase
MDPTDYEKYIRTTELLTLQKRPEELSCHDELQFQIVHQVMELLAKLCEHEVRYAAGFLREGHPTRAIATLKRVAIAQRLLIQKLDLLDTMSPKAYMTVRAALKRGSGQESPGFRQMLKLPGETLWPAFVEFLRREQLTIRQVYEDPDKHHTAFQVCESLVDYDQLLQAWRYRHLIMVYRIIGVGTPSLKGKPSDLLAHGMKQQFFPELWHVRDELFELWQAGTDTGYHG